MRFKHCRASSGIFAAKILVQHLRVALDIAQRRLQIMRDGIGERLQFLVGAASSAVRSTTRCSKSLFMLRTSSSALAALGDFRLERLVRNASSSVRSCTRISSSSSRLAQRSACRFNCSVFLNNSTNTETFVRSTSGKTGVRM